MMAFRHLLLIDRLLLMLIVTGFTLPLASSASSQQSTPTCAEAKASAQRRLAGIRNLTVKIETLDFSTAYPDHPEGRSDNYMVSMQGKAVSSVMNSPLLMKTIASDVLNACDTIGMVTFGQANSGWFQRVGMFADGMIDFFKCAEDVGINPGRGSEGRLRWGLNYCSI